MKFKIFLITALMITAGVFLFQNAQTSTASSTQPSTTNNLEEPQARSSKVGTAAQVDVNRDPFPFQWQTIANNGFLVPGSDLKFSSYGQPSVNTDGLVVFRARTTGGGGGEEAAERESGVYMRHFPKGPVQDVANLRTYVPQPNNLDTLFTEFPAIGRIAMNTPHIATRGNHQPVYRYLLPDETETRVGTTGIYAFIGSGELVTGAAKLGLVPGFEYFAVPNTDPQVAFDVFPGAPAINDEGTIAFKGNYTVDGIGKTGVFFRNLLDTPGGGKESTYTIATSDTLIPGVPGELRFGSTAPPSVANNNIVFVGLDNEENPSYGGIYLAPMIDNPVLRTLVSIGQAFPGLNIPAMTRIGEGLSFDGRYVGFWGAWGTTTKALRLYCPQDGNADIIAYCNGVDPKSIFDNETQRWYQNQTVPMFQGIFVYDTYNDTVFLASTTSPATRRLEGYNDFIYWGYSGAPPGVGSEGDVEPPRWRAASFLAVSNGKVVFKARTGLLNAQGVYIDPIDGLYMASPAGSRRQIVAETGMNGTVLDPTIETPGFINLPIVGLGIEREGFRGNHLAITATMADTENSWGGIYVTDISATP